MRPLCLLIANNFPPVRGGSAVVYDNLARCADGCIAVLAASLNYGDGLPLVGWREHDRGAPYSVTRLPLLRTPILGRTTLARRIWLQVQEGAIRVWVLATVLRLLRRTGARTVCIGELMASGWLVRALGHTGCRTVAYVHGEEITTDQRHDRGGRNRRATLAAVDSIVVVSRFTWAAVVELMGEAVVPKLTLIPNGVDVGLFKPRPRRPDLVDAYGLAGCFVFVSVCRLLEKKGVDNTLRAFARLADPSCRYVIAGDGPFRPELEALAETLGIAGRVRFAGQLPADDLIDHYCLGDVFVMPNRALPDGDTEGFGLVFLEANACGLPVIAGRDGGSTDAVQDGENGLVVDGHSVDAIAAAMQRLRDDAALRRQLAEGGRAAVSRSSWEARTQAFLTQCVLRADG